MSIEQAKIILQNPADYPYEVVQLAIKTVSSGWAKR